MDKQKFLKFLEREIIKHEKGFNKNLKRSFPSIDDLMYHKTNKNTFEFIKECIERGDFRPLTADESKEL